jgi:hypothetical protein
MSAASASFVVSIAVSRRKSFDSCPLIGDGFLPYADAIESPIRAISGNDQETTGASQLRL